MQVIKIVIIIFIRTATVPVSNPWIAMLLIPFILGGFAKSLIPGIPFLSDSQVVSQCPTPDSVFSCTYSKHYLNGSNFFDTDNYYDFNIKAGQVEENWRGQKTLADSNLNCTTSDENYVNTRHHMRAQQIGTCFRLYAETASSKNFKTITVEVTGKSESKDKTYPTKTIKISKSEFKANGDKVYFNLYDIVSKYESTNGAVDGSLVKITNIED
jgi:hypothetical protein